MPYNFQRYSSNSFRVALSELCSSQSFDIVQVEMPMLWQYSGLFADLPVVLDAHNVEHDLIKSFRRDCHNPIKRALYSLEEKKFKRSEETAWRDCSYCFAVSEKEKEIIGSCIGDINKVMTIPNGVDLEKFVFQPKMSGGQRILFLGGMDWAPNLDSARFFLTEILPLVRKKLPGTQVDFVGKDLWRIKNLVRADDIHLHENVPEVLPWLHQADLLAVPLRQGAGTRIKILEAMAAGLPVVTTSKGCDGTEAVNGRHLLIADSAQEFAGEVDRLIGDKSLAAKLAREARALVEKKYSWEMAAASIHEALSKLL
jgi:glycosyltransferase involved in cell wall biosynthesis